MKETSFIEQNKAKWKKFQKLTENQTSDPEEIADLYADITNDLSYAQTFYGKRTVRVYLNQLAQGIHNLVHKQRRDSWKKLFSIWRVSIPLEVYRSRKNLLFALFVFIFWTAVGAISTHYNNDFPRMIFGDNYVDMTLKNIEKGDPLGVYHSSSQVAMFLEITLNNITVSFYAFIFGILFTIGTHIIIFQNAIMLGSFQYFFYTKGLLMTSFLGIWIHGAFEISSIALSAGAGITLGNGLLFPGSYTRLQSLQLAAKRGLKIMIGLVPFLIVAGFLESFVTHRYLELSEWSKWGIILFSFSFILFYFVVYPIVVARRNPELVQENDPPVRTLKNTFQLEVIRSFSQQFSDTFSFYRVHIGRIVKLNLIYTMPLIVGVVCYQDVVRYDDLTHQYTFDWTSQLGIMMGVDFVHPAEWFVLFVWTVVFTIWALSVFAQFKYQGQRLGVVEFGRYLLQRLPATWLGFALLFVVLFLLPWYWMLVAIFVVPLIWHTGSAAALGNQSFGQNLSRGFSYGSKDYWNTVFGVILLCVVLFLFAQPIAFIFSHQDNFLFQRPIMSDLLDKLADFVKDVARYYTDDFVVPSNVVRQVVYVFFMLFVLPLFTILMGFMYYSIEERQEAKGLKRQFTDFGKRSRVQETPIDFE